MKGCAHAIIDADKPQEHGNLGSVILVQSWDDGVQGLGIDADIFLAVGIVVESSVRGDLPPIDHRFLDHGLHPGV